MMLSVNGAHDAAARGGFVFSSAGGAAVTAQTDSFVKWSAVGDGNGVAVDMTVNVNGSLWMDGYGTYTMRVTTTKDLQTGGFLLTVPLHVDNTQYMFGTVRVFGQKLNTRSAIEFQDFAPLEALLCVCPMLFLSGVPPSYRLALQIPSEHGRHEAPWGTYWRCSQYSISHCGLSYTGSGFCFRCIVAEHRH
jgi:hypothetical protein